MGAILKISPDRITSVKVLPVMVDFSAEWCPTCKYNLTFAIETPRVKRALEEEYRSNAGRLDGWITGDQSNA